MNRNALKMVCVLLAVCSLPMVPASAGACRDVSRFYVHFPLFLQQGVPLFPVEYFTVGTSDPLRAALLALIQGPPFGDLRFLRVPATTEILHSVRDGNVAIVDFSQDILGLNVGSGGEAGLLSGIVNTVAFSGFPPSDTVLIRVEGQDVQSLAGHVDISGPLRPSLGTHLTVIPDVEGHWSGGTVCLLQALDVIHGFDDGTFRPENQVTRGEFVKILTQVLESQSASTHTPFEDVEGHWAYPYIAQAVEFGIISASEYGTMFHPDEILPRDEMGHMLFRAFCLYKEAHPDIVFDKLAGEPVFLDQGKIGARYLEGVLGSTVYGLIRGYPDGTFRPQDGVRRSEACAVVGRMLGMNEEKHLVLLPYKSTRWAEGRMGVLGCALAFEGNVRFRVLSKDGDCLFESHTTSTNGLGWGTFGFCLDASVIGDEGEFVEVFLESPKDGAEYSKITVPLT